MILVANTSTVTHT